MFSPFDNNKRRMSKKGKTLKVKFGEMNSPSKLEVVSPTKTDNFNSDRQ